MDIVKDPSKILRKKLKTIETISPELLDIIKDMKKIMIKAKGVGLAANQVGLDMSLFVIDEQLAKDNNVPEVYINPEMSEYSRDQAFMEEGCLSLPDFWTTIKRSKKVKLRAIDEHGDKIKIKARGFLARVYQHEFDHLQGTLIKDHS